MKIELEDKSFFGGSFKYTQTSLVPYAHWVTNEKEKSDAIKAYNRLFTEKDTIEQVPCDLADILNVSSAAINKSMTEYSEAPSEEVEEGEEKEPEMPLLANTGFGKQI